MAVPDKWLEPSPPLPVDELDAALADDAAVAGHEKDESGFTADAGTDQRDRTGPRAPH